MIKCEQQSNEVLIAIDPGDKHTGIVEYCYNTHLINNYLIDTTQIEGREQSLTYIDEIIAAYTSIGMKVVLVIERYLNYAHKSAATTFNQNQTSQLIGQIEHIVKIHNEKNNLTTIVYQNASQAKSWNDARLMRLGLIEKKSNKYVIPTYGLPLLRHTRDAYRHLIYYLNKHYFDNMINKQKVFN